MPPQIPVWGGLEATVNRVRDTYLDQFEISGCAERIEDLDRLAELGIKSLRFPVLWERVNPNAGEFLWGYPDAGLTRLNELGIEPIVGLLHHGSGPLHTDLLDPGFPEKLAAYARVVAERYPWIDAYTPVNEPLTTARFSALYGHWYPHRKDDLSFARALLNQMRATVLAMSEIRKVNPRARLVQTEDLGKVYATEPLAYQAFFENERRWLSWDLLCGRLSPDTTMWSYLTHVGIEEEELRWFLDHPCPPQVVGVNHYITSERLLDHRVENYPESVVGSNGRESYADVTAARVLRDGVDGFEGVLTEAWERYALPIAVTECHLGCTREEQLRWLVDAWEAAHRVRDEGADIVGFTVWSLFGAYDWDSLLTERRGHYEPGVFDLRGPKPRSTALAEVVRQLANGQSPSHPVLAEAGWWERDIRLHHPSVHVQPRFGGPIPREIAPQPVLIVGAEGMLGEALVKACELRGLPHIALSAEDLDITESGTVGQALRRWNPWAVINTAGCPGQADESHDRHSKAASELSYACARQGTPLATFSSESVFDGSKGEPYTEADIPSPYNEFGRRQLEAERAVRLIYPEALTVRTSTLFGPWHFGSDVHRALQAIACGLRPDLGEDVLVSPTYVPNLVHAVLDLLVDRESGTWHLTNEGTVSLHDFIRQIASTLNLGDVPPRSSSPTNCLALSSRRGAMLPPWQEAAASYTSEAGQRWLAIDRFDWM